MDQVSPQAAIRRGMERQLRARREAESKGSKPIGWKLGFGTPASLKRFRLSGPLVGFLTDRTSLQDGATCQIAGLKNPRLEAEVAIVVGTRPERANSHVAMPLITALAPAIEIIDLDAAEEDLERILVGNIFHRHVMIGSLSSQELDVPLSALSVSIRLNGLDVQRGLKPGLEARRMSDLLEHVVSTLAGFSEVVEAGSVIISGALSTPIPVGPGDQVEVRVDPVGQLAVKFA